VPFYGPPPAPAEAAKVKSPVLAHLAGRDDFVNPGWPAWEAALKDAGVDVTVHQYPGTQHGFNNDTTPRYDAEAAKLAWQRTISFFHTHLGPA
jgi:carboxymethylenebutenolidase